MSLSLLRKSLELCDSECITIKGNKSNETAVKIVKKRSNPKPTRGIADVKRKNSSTIEQVKKRIKKQKIKYDENLKRLKILRKPVIKEELAKQILERQRKPGVSEKKVEFKEPESAFTEEDFLRFEREYQDDG